MFLASWPKRFNTWAGIVGAARTQRTYQLSIYEYQSTIKSLNDLETRINPSNLLCPLKCS